MRHCTVSLLNAVVEKSFLLIQLQNAFYMELMKPFNKICFLRIKKKIHAKRPKVVIKSKITEPLRKVVNNLAWEIPRLLWVDESSPSGKKGGEKDDCPLELSYSSSDGSSAFEISKSKDITSNDEQLVEAEIKDLIRFVSAYSASVLNSNGNKRYVFKAPSVCYVLEECV